MEWRTAAFHFNKSAVQLFAFYPKKEKENMIGFAGLFLLYNTRLEKLILILSTV
jgi:hypothetical protein